MYIIHIPIIIIITSGLITGIIFKDCETVCGTVCSIQHRMQYALLRCLIYKSTMDVLSTEVLHCQLLFTYALNNLKMYPVR